MKKHLFACALLTAPLPAAAHAGSHFNAPADVAAIATVEQNLATQLDINIVINYYAPNAIVYDVFAPGIYKGRPQIRANLGPELAGIKALQASIKGLDIVSDGTMACAASQLSFIITPKSGPSLPITMRQLDAYRKLNGTWRLIEQHISYPTDFKTGLGLLDAPIAPSTPLVWKTNPFAGPSESPARAKAEIKTWLEAYAIAPSTAALPAYFGPGDTTLAFTMAEPSLLEGLKPQMDFYAPMVAGTKSITAIFPDFNVDSDGNFAVQIDTQIDTLNMQNGTATQTRLRESDCLHRVNGKWYSFFDMLSYPIDPKTGKSALN